ncbi:M protein trans-acting positive regulator, partial [Enterococcus faecalis]
HLNQRAGYAQANCFHFLAVSLVRTQQQLYVEKKVDSQVLKQLAGDNLQNVFNWLESLQVPEPQRTNEGNYLLFFLIAVEWL